MRSVIDRRFQDEAQAFNFVFFCESCAHFDVDTGACANGYPNHDHRFHEVMPGGVLLFCKEFELG